MDRDRLALANEIERILHEAGTPSALLAKVSHKLNALRCSQAEHSDVRQAVAKLREIADFNTDNRFGRLALEAIADIEAQSPPMVSELRQIAQDLRDNYPAVDLTNTVFSADFAGVYCCVIPQDRVLEIIAALSREEQANG